MLTANTEARRQKAVLKCKTEYRKILSAINKQIDTVQIKQCGLSWANIDFNKTTSITLSKQKKAFLNVKKAGVARYPDNVDRVGSAPPGSLDSKHELLVPDVFSERDVDSV